jgi:RimJ/RimL family protein N-acetyltransferase
MLGAGGADAWSGPAWWLPEQQPDVDAVLLGPDDLDPLAGEFDYVREEYEALAPVAVVLRDGRAVAACRCSRRTVVAAEAGVDTVDGHTGRGHATVAVGAWAEAVRATGRFPLYSTSWTNLASQRIAAKLAAVPYGTDWSLG